MFLSASRRGPDEDELPDQLFVFGVDLLRDEATERKAQQIDLAKAEQVDEGDGIFRHRCDIVRGLAGRTADAGVVERDDRAIGGERVDHRGVPGIEIAREVLQENQRRSGRRAEAAISEAYSMA